MTSQPHLTLCAVDFSTDARRALEAAAGLAALWHAPLLVHTAIDPLLADAAAGGAIRDHVRDTRAELSAFVAEATAAVAPSLQPRLAVTIGDAAPQILDVAAFYQADVIVMGAQGLGRIDRPVFGSVTDEVVRATSVPVLVVPPRTPPLLASSSPFARGGVLAAVDLRESSSEVAEIAAALARLFGVPLVLTHVVPPVEAPPRWSTPSATATRVHAAVAEIDLETLSTVLDAPVIPLVTIGHPAEAIAEASAAHDAGLVVIGIGSTDAFGVRRFGSTAYRVLSFTSVPVLVVPPFSAGRANRTGRSLEKEVTA